MFPGATKAKTVDISDQQTETTAVDDMERVIGAEDTESRKRRHENGDIVKVVTQALMKRKRRMLMRKRKMMIVVMFH